MTVDVGHGWRVILGAAAAIALGGAALGIVWLVARPVAMLLMAITLARGLDPMVTWVSRRMPRVLAVSLVFLGIVGVLTAIGLLVVPRLRDQASEIQQAAPEFARSADAFLRRWTGWQNPDISQLLRNAAGPLAEIPKMLASGLGALVVIGFLSVYWLIEEAGLYAFLLSLMPSARRARVGRVLVDMGDAMGGYLRGAMINASIMGVLSWVMLVLLGIPYAGVLGLVFAVGEIVPYVGPIVAAVPAVGIALTVSAHKALLVLLLYVALEQVEGHLLTPNIMRTQTHAPAGLVLLSFTTGWFIGGLLGAIVAIPVGAALRVLIVDVAAPAARRHVES